MTTARTRAMSTLVGALLMVAAACGDSTATVVTDDAGSPSLPETEAVVVFDDEGYFATPDGFGGNAEEQTLPVPLGAVSAAWYRADTWIVVFDGLAATEPVCVGTSIEVERSSLFGDRSLHLTTSPLVPGACDGAFTESVVGGERGLRVCPDGTVVYVTAIPGELEGSLVATLEAYEPDGILVGIVAGTGGAGAATIDDAGLAACTPPVEVPAKPAVDVSAAAAAEDCEALVAVGLGYFQEALDDLAGTTLEDFAAQGADPELLITDELEERAEALASRSVVLDCTEEEVGLLYLEGADTLQSDGPLAEFLVATIRSLAEQMAGTE